VAVDPLLIIERQLERLFEISERTTLTYEESQTLERLVRTKLLLKMKDISASEDEKALDEVSAEELKRLLGNMK
jgi:hypothetical protein